MGGRGRVGVRFRELSRLSTSLVPNKDADSHETQVNTQGGRGGVEMETDGRKEREREREREREWDGWGTKHSDRRAMHLHALPQ